MGLMEVVAAPFTLVVTVCTGTSQVALNHYTSKENTTFCLVVGAGLIWLFPNHICHDRLDVLWATSLCARCVYHAGVGLTVMVLYGLNL